MTTYHVNVIIENKPGISDPEGDTILNDLVIKNGTTKITNIKTAKMLRFTIDEKDKKSAKHTIQKICDELRIYNPLVSKIAMNITDKNS